MPKHLEKKRDDLAKRQGDFYREPSFGAGVACGFNACWTESREWCRCGDVILADTEDFPSPMCDNCYSVVEKYFKAKYAPLVEAMEFHLEFYKLKAGEPISQALFEELQTRSKAKDALERIK